VAGGSGKLGVVVVSTGGGGATVVVVGGPAHQIGF
jgi:hypothetical protein